MTVVTRASNIFTAPNLPIMSDLIKSGMVLGLRPVQTTGVIDISPSQASLTAVGAPTMTAAGVRVGPMNYYRSNVQEPRNLTLIAGFRISSGPSLSGTAQLIGSLRGSFSASNGSGIYAGLFASSPNYIGLTYGSSNGPGGSRASVFPTGVVIAQPAPTNYVSPWLWCAVTIDSDGIAGRRYVAKAEGPIVAVAANGLTAAMGDRDRASLILGAFDDVAVDNHWRFEMAELLVYNRAFSEAEVQQQYRDSLLYMKAIGAQIGT
ncbi:hypothetical protein J2732_001955 [Achromobacter deleyi]|uniref:hypothetical protein n=1 Tax=Achromobacter deleyi TaxID=1353891 RepID=UPI00286634D6|nr:hypothetical protein [Achromobacter deleyi]MDR6600972.1 hypothetical protein [Achromobacter deleyi]